MNSDRRLKKDIQYLDQLLPTITSIRPAKYRWKKDQKDDRLPSLGVIAQELELLFPQAVHTDEDGQKMVNYDALGVLAIQAVKEQQTMINEMREQMKVNTQFIKQLMNDSSKDDETTINPLHQEIKNSANSSFLFICRVRSKKVNEKCST